MKKLVLFVWIIFSFLPMEAEMLSEHISPGSRNFLAIRVEFQADNSYLTTGNGQFMMTEWTGHDTSYVLDPLPHDRNYFKSHMSFINNYWNRASAGNIHINTDNAYQIPLDSSPYVLSEQMRYYSAPDSLDYRLADLVYETVKMAIDSGDFISDNDGLIIFHAGAGQDFNIDLDNSPFDIPSFYFDANYLSEFLPSDKYMELESANALCGIVLPESQNQLGVNIALNGTEILLTGMLLGLPTLYDTELGRSGAGIYGLMDQGSNTGSGLCPIKPSAFERYLLGAVDPIEVTRTDTITMYRDDVYKLPISSNEYFLLEFRKNTGVWADSLMYVRDDIHDYLDLLGAFDSLGLINYTMENGVLTDVSDLDLGLPANGLLIWHILEPETFGENPNSESDWFLNLVEADGGDDIGKWYGSVLDESITNGWKWDMWFYDNPGFKQNNPTSYKIQFNDSTHPNSRSKANLPSGISINNFIFHPDSVVLRVAMDTPSLKNFDGLVFDELTTAVPATVTSSTNLIGYKDSSLYVFDGKDLTEVYRQDSVFIKGNDEILTYDNSDIILVTNNGSSASISHLVYTGSVLNNTVTTMIPYPVDLDHLAIHGDSLFVTPIPSEDSKNFYMLDIPSWTLEAINTSYAAPAIPYVRNGQINYFISKTAAGISDTLIYAYDMGYIVDDGNPHAHIADLSGNPAHAGEFEISDLIPLYLDDQKGFDVIALADYDGRTVLTAFNHLGYLLNGFPIFENYTKIRVYELDDELLIAAYDPSGIIDVYDKDARKVLSLPVPVNASSFFIEQVQSDTAWIVVDGSIYAVESDDVYWGYAGKDAAYSNYAAPAHSSVTVSSDELIRDGLVYNYPNPAEGTVTKFRFFATGATYATVDIFALDGRFINSIECNAVDQQWNEVPWDISNEVSGVYLAKIKFTDGTKTETYFVKPAILK